MNVRCFHHGLVIAVVLFLCFSNESVVFAEIVSARPADLELMRAVEDQSFLGLEMLGGLKASDSPELIIARIDQYIQELQESDSIPWDAWYEYYAPLGTLWGEQIGRTYGWEWERIWLEEHEGDFVYAIVSPNRSMMVYPFQYIISCVESGRTVAVSQVYRSLGANKRLQELPAGSYTDILSNLAFLVMYEEE